MTAAQGLSVSTPNGIKSIRPRVLKALERMVFHAEKRSEAARRAGLADITLRRALHEPHILAHYNRLLKSLRDSERARNLHTGIKIRDDKHESGKIRLQAARYLDGDHAGQGMVVNVGLAVNVQPGYIADISAHSQQAKQILQQSGSTRNALDDE